MQASANSGGLVASSTRYRVVDDGTRPASPSASGASTPVGGAHRRPLAPLVPKREDLRALALAQDKDFTVFGHSLFKRKVEPYKSVLECVDRYQAAAARHRRHSTDRKCINELDRATEALQVRVTAKLLDARSACKIELERVRDALNGVAMPAQTVSRDNLERKSTPAVTPGHSRTATVWHVSPRVGAPEQIVKHETRGSRIGDAARRAGITGQWSDRAVATAALARQLGLGHLVPETRAVESKAGKSLVMDLAPGMPPQALGSLQVRLPADLNDTLKRRPDLLATYVAERRYTGHLHDGAQGILTLHHVHKNARALMDAHGKPVVNLRGEPVREDVRGPIFTRVDYRRGDVRRGITEAQWLDTMSGEMDRTGANFHLDIADGGALRSVSAFDNETAFGQLIDSADSGVGLALSAHDPDSPRVSHRAHMAGVIGHTLSQAIEGFDPRALDQMLGDVPADASQRLVRDVANRLREGKATVLHTDQDWEREDVALTLGLVDFAAQFDRVATDAKTAPAAMRTQALMSGLRRVCNTAHDISYVAREAANLALQDWLARHAKDWPQAPLAAPVYSHADLRDFMARNATTPRRLRAGALPSPMGL